MDFKDIAATVVDLFQHPATARQSVYLSGPPGVGKTSVAYTIADKLGIPDGNVLVWRPSLHDPVDLLGVPSVNAGRTVTNPPDWLHTLAHGNHLLVVDELPQSVVMMQNALAGLVLDRRLGDLVLSDGVRIIATGNRQQDKAGSNRIVSQLGNRVLHLEMESGIDSWVAWAIEKNIDVMAIAFLKLKAQHLFDFEPSRLTNATPRSWEMAANIPTTMPANRYLAALAGVIPEGIAAEYVAFRKLASKMPSIDLILLRPDKAEIPEETEVKYAVTATLSMRATKDNFDSLAAYVSRLPTEFQVLFMKMATGRDMKLCESQAFVKWASKNAEFFK